MRSLKAERSSRGRARAKPARRGQSSTRAPRRRGAPAKKSLGGDGFVARTWKFASFALTSRWPILKMTGVLLIVTFFAALFAGGYVSGAFKSLGNGRDRLIADAGFDISSIQFTGNTRTQPAAILSALGFEPGQSIFAADIQTARARLLALDWVADAQIRRQFPDVIAVSIVEKLPFALWQTQDGLFVVERSGRVITRADPKDFPRLPLFIGDGAPSQGAELVDAVALHRAVVARVRAMQFVSGRRWNLLLDDHVVVELPEAGWRKELDVLEHLIVDKAVLERDITEIDLRSADHFTFQLRGGDRQQQITRGNAT